MKHRSLSIAAATAALSLALAGCSSSDTDTAASGGTGIAGSIKASGSSAQKNAMIEWVNAFQTANPDVTIDYQPTGSGAGVQDFINDQTAFGGSDAAIAGDDKTAADARCEGGQAINLPMVGGAIAIAYNLDGVDSLTLTPEVIAGIFNNKITKWNDPKITALNDGVALPDATIAQFHRSDDSGTTANFADYLSQTAPDDWPYEVGKTWPAPGGQGSKGSDGVASSVGMTPNSIGYMELSFTEDAGLSSALIDNGGGAVPATFDTAAATIEAATIVGSDGDLSLELDYTVADSSEYPIVLVTYEITCSAGLPEADLAIVKPFLQYTASDEGQALLSEIGYVPIVGDLLTKVRDAVDAL